MDPTLLDFGSPNLQYALYQSPYGCMVLSMKGRGAPENPTGRFEKLTYDANAYSEEIGQGLTPEELLDESGEPAPRTVPTAFFKDSSKSILSKNDSPDVGFDLSINPYRGCEHGCIYCYARPTHEYLGLSPGLDFETKIFVKEEAPALLRAALAAKNYQPQTIFMSGVTDCYQPIERKLQLTRRCLEVLAECRNPVWIVTKNALVARDVDYLSALAKVGACGVSLSLTTLDNDLCGKLEPRTSRPAKRLEAIRILADAGVPVGVNLAPIIPALNEPEIPALLEAAKAAGAQFAWYTCVRLPYAVKDLFADWLGRHFPEKKERILSNIRQVRGGKLNDSTFGSRMKGEGLFAERIEKLFKIHRKRQGLDGPSPELSSAHFIRPTVPPAPKGDPAQLGLF